LNTRTTAPSAMPRASGVVGVDLQHGRPSMSRRLCTFTKVEFKKLRAGGEIMASG
jgi:hypothetical protein